VFADRSIPATLILETASAQSISTKQGSLYKLSINPIPSQQASSSASNGAVHGSKHRHVVSLIAPLRSRSTIPVPPLLALDEKDPSTLT
jgi:hypothetical protein